MNRALLDPLFAAGGAADWGWTSYETLMPHMDENAREKAESLCPGAQCVLVCAVPYYAGDAPGNLSLYARGKDYHLVLGDLLNPICEVLHEKYPGYCFVPGVDNSPLPEREAAWAAGIGLRGEHGLVIVPPYGSWVFLGTILTDHPAPPPDRTPSSPCIRCGKCRKICPGGALRGEIFDPERCLSHLTQKKGELPPEQEALLASHPLAWGCDLCQRVCPYNAHPKATELSTFRDDLVENLTEDMVEGVTNRQFKERYGDRAFAWRGPAVIRRNLALQTSKN